ncbi:MAG: hypothetical protein FWF77_05325 [Defluviitaleaceae bacterium]|nr:hypothetical protein [Defluviitaleaceae bacterium]
MLEQLLAIESDAQEAMNDIEKETAVLAQSAREGLARRIAEIEREGTEAIHRLAVEAELDTATQIARAQEEWREKNENLEKFFVENREKMRGKIFHDVLYGAPE